jgi:hypothetical protein
MPAFDRDDGVDAGAHRGEAWRWRGGWVVAKAGRTGRVFGSARAFLGSARVGLGPRREWTESSPVFRPAASFWLGKLGSVQPESSLFVFFFTKSKRPKGNSGLISSP